MTTVDELREDLAALTEILSARRAVPTETLGRTDRIYWSMYLSSLLEVKEVLKELIAQLEDSR